ncbi:hypothetical protein P5673_018538 [Acropora cervicornis]|uniref:Uncharacterized protein n=1 Tax=Acropora cervicornis TaxID=6130 RepID=A0AAD9V326_ACRCE|nr:hypothetical protein P5673_018538 [Acropora cervicornis]
MTGGSRWLSCIVDRSQGLRCFQSTVRTIDQKMDQKIPEATTSEDYKSSVSLSRVEREAKLGVLLDHYGQEKGGVKPLVDPNGCKLEYQLLEPLVKANYCGLSMRDLWAVISTKYNDQFPELIKLSQIATLIPVSTADTKRGDLVIKIGPRLSPGLDFLGRQ